jgi:adenylate cyclase
MPKSRTPEEWWRRLLTGDDPDLPIRHFRHFLKFIPASPRCQFCNAPYHGPGAALMRLLGKGPSRLTPHLCQQCQGYASRYLGGAEIELSMLFADVRGSTALAEGMSPAEFSRLISRFFAVASKTLAAHGAWVDRFVGDQAVGYFVPGFAGPDHTGMAFQAAIELLAGTGHNDPAGPWVPVGVGIHTGCAFVGAVGSAGQATDITALGDAPNTAARLASAAGPGEILISAHAYTQLSPAPAVLERRSLALKGKSEPFEVFVFAAMGEDHEGTPA